MKAKEAPKAKQRAWKEAEHWLPNRKGEDTEHKLEQQKNDRAR